ncbi:MAG: phosphoglycolate phosphatase [Thermoplasmata archaeon]|nr:phosphoglycolate phosphatase [Thermoplasmata archaeon]
MVPRRGSGSRPIRAVVTDIDGTLTDHDRRLDTKAVELLRTLHDAQVPVFLATGNVLPIALALHRSIGLTGPIVAENGGILYERRDGVEHIERLARRALALTQFRRLRRRGFDLRPLFTDRWRETEVGLEPNVEPGELAPFLRGTPVRVEGTGFAIHLMERGAGKLPALRRALRTSGLTLFDCLVAGDGDNDVAMLRAAGWAVTFASGSPRAKKAADYVADASSSQGFVEALKASGVVPGRGSSRRSDDARR